MQIKEAYVCKKRASDLILETFHSDVSKCFVFRRLIFEMCR